ncbi:uncharacterized protein [Littorina saxatilis]|uniref:Uncharacterized protein n=1 Tax=Littorina saxatilis TaxID=31220 RepID=A0AAN9G5E1_9CAEN
MAASNAKSLLDKILTAANITSTTSSTPRTTVEDQQPEEKSTVIIIVGIFLSIIVVILIAVVVFLWWKRLLCCHEVNLSKPSILAQFAMFKCCAKCFCQRNQDQTTDEDCQWRSREGNSARSKGANRSRNDNSSGFQHPVFYLDSGDSTDTESVHASRRHRQRAKLDPNSELQRKSKLHNEKLPSFSALDRSKRPRLRKKEDSFGTEGDGISLVLEPLTFETFRSYSPPLAVIAPLSNSNTEYRSPHRDGVSSRSSLPSVIEDSKQQCEFTVVDPSLSSKSKQNSSGVTNGGKSVPLLYLIKAYSEDTNDSESLEGCVNEGYSVGDVDEELATSHSAYSSEAEELPSQHPHVHRSTLPRREKHKARPPQRPATLQLPDPCLHNSWSSLNSTSTLPEESLHSEAADDTSETVSHTQDSIPSSKGAPDMRTLNGDCRDQRCKHSDNTDNTLKVVTDEKTKELHEDSDSTPKGKKTPPQKPKRKNPPSNVSTVESREAIVSALMTSNGTVTSSEHARQKGDSIERGDETRVENGLLPPPFSFKDIEFADFDDFDEVNGSLV